MVSHKKHITPYNIHRISYIEEKEEGSSPRLHLPLFLWRRKTMTTFVPTTLLLGKKLLEVNGSFSGMTLHQFLNETGNSHLFIKKDGMVAINTLLEQSGLMPISCDEALVAVEDLKMTSLRSQFGFFIKPTQYKRQNPEVLVRLGNNRKVVFHRYYFGNGYMANLVYQVEDDQIEFCQSSVFKSWDNGEYHITYDTPVTEDVEDINTRKELLSFLSRVEELPSVK